MANMVIKGGTSQQIVDGSQDTLSLLAISTGTGLIHIGEPAPEGFDVPFAGGDQIVLPANLSATLRADGFVVTGSVGSYGGQTYEGGGGLLPTQAIVDDGDTITATGGQTIDVAVADNDATFTVKNWAFWEPFTVTVGTNEWEGEPGYMLDGHGAISNQPVSGFILYGVIQQGDEGVIIYIYGPHPIAGELQGSLIGIDGVDYSPSKMQSAWVGPDAPGEWEMVIEIADVAPWTVGQQIPIVIIPQNGG